MIHLYFHNYPARSADNISLIWFFNIETASFNCRITSFNWLTSSDVLFSLQAMAIFSTCQPGKFKRVV